MGFVRISIITFFLCQSAFAIEFAEFGALNATIPNTSAAGASPGIAPGLGASLAIDINNQFSIEPEVLYLGRKFTANPGLRTTYRFNFIQVPLLLRYRLNPSFVVGVGPYYSYTIGNINTNTDSSSQTLGTGDLSLDNKDIGFIGSIRYRALMHEFIHIIVDARFVYGFSNLSKIEGQNLSFRDLQILFGIAFVL
jgi:hypothetical protein